MLDDVSGLLTPPEDADALGDAIIRLLEDPALAARLGSRAAADAQGRFSWRAIAGIIHGTCFAEPAAEKET
jgi:glycosyltransferase involved in cell wall biosynthesis